MAFVDSLPSDSSSDGSTNCRTQAGNSLTDNGTLSTVYKAGGSGINVNFCYGGSITTLNWPDINVSGAVITGVRFTVDANANVDDLSTAMQYQISINGGSSFTSAAALDLTGAPIPNSLTTAEFHTTTSETELHGLDWSGLSLADINSGDKVIFKWSINSGESGDNVINSDFTKIRVYYGGVTPRSTYSNATDEQVISAGAIAIKNGLLKF